MNLQEIKKNWDQFGKEDPYWAILTDPKMKGNRWDEKAFFNNGSTHIKRIVNRLRRRYPALTFNTALDFGCGAGRLTQELSNHFSQVIGVDIAPSMIELARAKNKHPNCSYIQNDANNLSIFENDRFDFVLSLITLQHMQPEYAKNYIQEFIRVLKPGGVAMFQVPGKPDSNTLNHHNASIKPTLNRNANSKDQAQPIMEMYWIPIQEMVHYLVMHDVRISHVLEDKSCGEDWDSYTYTVIKLG